MESLETLVDRPLSTKWLLDRDVARPLSLVTGYPDMADMTVYTYTVKSNDRGSFAYTPR